MKETSEFQTQSRKSLLRKYEIPIDHLDFRYLETCTDAREVERILKILRSGEEGRYPELEQFAASKLQELAPTSRVLRVEVPVLRSESLGKDELKALEDQFLAWTLKEEEFGDGDSSKIKSKAIFDSDMEPGLETIELGQSVPPIRFAKPDEFKEKLASGSKAQNLDRIKSCDYDKWDKFDVDAELTKLEVGDLKQAEFDLSSHRKQVLREQQQVIKKLMKNQDPEDIDVLVPPEVKLRLNAKKNINSKPSSSRTIQGSEAGNVVDSSDVPLLEDCESLIRPASSSKKRSERLEVNQESVLEKSLVVSKAADRQWFKRDLAPTSSKVSLIEDISEGGQEMVKQKRNDGDKKSKRKFKIHIEDLNVRY